MAHSAVVTADIDPAQWSAEDHYVQNWLDTLKNFATACFTFSYLDSFPPAQSDFARSSFR